MPPQTEEIDVTTPSGETVTVRVPSGMKDDDIKSLLKQKQPELFTTPAPNVNTSTDQHSYWGDVWDRFKEGFAPHQYAQTVSDSGYGKADFDPFSGMAGHTDHTSLRDQLSEAQSVASIGAVLSGSRFGAPKANFRGLVDDAKGIVGRAGRVAIDRTAPIKTPANFRPWTKVAGAAPFNLVGGPEIMNFLIPEHPDSIGNGLFQPSQPYTPKPSVFDRYSPGSSRNPASVGGGFNSPKYSTSGGGRGYSSAFEPNSRGDVSTAPGFITVPENGPNIPRTFESIRGAGNPQGPDQLTPLAKSGERGAVTEHMRRGGRALYLPNFIGRK